jgi:hypothetical protein
MEYTEKCFKTSVVAPNKMNILWFVHISSFCSVPINVTVGWFALFLHVWDVLPSNLSPDASNPDSGFCGFPQSLCANAKIAP